MEQRAETSLANKEKYSETEMQQRARLWETVGMKKRIKGSKRKQRGRKESTRDFFSSFYTCPHLWIGCDAV